MDAIKYYSQAKQIEDLKSMIQLPKLYLCDYFIDLRNEIDTFYVQNGLGTSETNKSWTAIINKTYEFEAECMAKINNKSFDEISTQIEQTESNSLNSDESIGLLDDLEHKLKSMLFSNKTIIFLIQTNLDVTNSLIYNSPLLLIISNYFICAKTIELFKYHLKTSHLTSEYLIANEITSKTSNVKTDIIEIELFSQKVLILPHKFSLVENDSFMNQTRLESLTISLQSTNHHLFKSLANLKHLCLFDCSLTQLDESLLKCLNNLEELTLDSNRISIVYESAFENLRKLKVLNIANNHIRSIRLNGLHSLEVFNLKNNKIYLVSFKEMPSLLSLNLESNRLTRLDTNSIKNVNNLKTLKFNHNFLSFLPNDVFTHLNKLVKLDLSYNKLSIINKTAFKELSYLEELYLQFNKLKKINETLTGLTRLKVLNLSNNQIDSLDESLDLISLKVLYLNDNNLTNFKEEILERLSSLSELFLFNNKIKWNDLTRIKEVNKLKKRRLLIKIDSLK